MVIQCIAESTVHHNVQPHFISVPYDDVEYELCYLLKNTQDQGTIDQYTILYRQKTICLQILGPLATSVAIFSNTWL